MNNRNSLVNISKWKNELRAVEQDVPIIMLSTKKDLRDHLKAGETISSDEMKKAKKENGLIGLHDTTSKEWKDFNVHKAFNKSIKAAINYKYDDDEDEDSDDEE